MDLVPASGPGVLEFVFPVTGDAVRTVEADGRVWFVGSDLARVLEYDDARNALRSVRDKNRGRQIVTTPGGQQECLCVNEPGLYELIMKSRSAKAEVFQDWVTDDVLPQIRRTGGYLASLTPAEQLVVHAQRLVEQERRQAELQAEQRRLERQQLETRLKVLEQSARIDNHGARLEAVEEHHGWVTALGYAKLHGLPTDITYLNQLGKSAAAIGAERGLNPSKVHSTLFGTVNAWPDSVWEGATLTA